MSDQIIQETTPKHAEPLSKKELNALFWRYQLQYL